MLPAQVRQTAAGVLTLAQDAVHLQEVTKITCNTAAAAASHTSGVLPWTVAPSAAMQSSIVSAVLIAMMLPVGRRRRRPFAELSSHRWSYSGWLLTRFDAQPDRVQNSPMAGRKGPLPKAETDRRG